MSVKRAFALAAALWRSIRACGPTATFAIAVEAAGCREAFFRKAFSYLLFNRIDGDYVEMGTYQGRSVIAAHRASRAIGSFHRAVLPLVNPDWVPRDFSAIRFFACDSFAGLPPSADSQVNPEHREGAMACGLGQFQANVRSAGCDDGRIIAVPGYFDQSLTPATRERLNLTRAAMVFIDCDIYESTVSALDFAADILADGAILAFDDWFLHRGDPNRGQRLAYTQWLQRRPDLVASDYATFGWHGKAFIVNRA